MALLKRASSVGHPQARKVLGLGKAVLIHSLVAGQAEYCAPIDTPAAAPAEAAAGHHTSSHASSSGGGGGGREDRGAGPELNGTVGVAAAFDDARNRFVVQLPSGDRVLVRAENIRMER